jgi:ABC-type Na+ efflux pump permease subunit
VRWELRRLGATRSTWVVIVLAFAIFVATELLFRGANLDTITYASGTTRTYWIDWGSNYGLLNTLPQIPGVLLGLYLPFIAADGVARDVHRRTHELLMASAVPSRTYVWGRFLSSLLLCVGLAFVMLAALLAVTMVRHLVQPDVFLAPDLPGILALWALIVLPPTLLLSGVSFMLGTLYPKRATFVKLAVLVAWFTLANLLGRTAPSCQQCAYASGDVVAHAAWDPTSLALQNLQSPTSLSRQLASQTQALSNAAFLAHVHALEQQLPNMTAWILPHLTWTLSGFALAAVAAFAFRRFRQVIG